MPPNPYPDVKGFATPHMVMPDPVQGVLNAFSDPAVVDAMSKGYGCGYCAALFTRFLLECPICRRPTSVSGLRQDAPQEWKDHVAAREAPIRTRGVEVEPGVEYADEPEVRTAEDFLRDIAGDPDVDQVPLSKLKPSRRGAQ